MLFVSTDRGYVPAKDEHILAEGVATAKRLFDQRQVQLLGREEAIKYLIPLLATKQYEVTCIAFLDSDKKLIAFEEICQGSALMCALPPRRVVARALELNATAIIMVHNHPTGTHDPSDDDINLTIRLKMIVEQLEIEMLEHYVVGKSGVCAISVEYDKRMQSGRQKLDFDATMRLLRRTIREPEAG